MIFIHVSGFQMQFGCARSESSRRADSPSANETRCASTRQRVEPAAITDQLESEGYPTQRADQCIQSVHVKCSITLLAYYIFNITDL